MAFLWQIALRGKYFVPRPTCDKRRRRVAPKARRPEGAFGAKHRWREAPKAFGAKHRRHLRRIIAEANCELVLIRSCSFSIKMGGVEMGFDLNIVWFEIWIMGEYFMAKPPA